jgi:YesN/AraC family two-component response regulator
MIKVLLADDHAIVRAGLVRIVEESGDIEVVAEASDGREALRLAAHKLPMKTQFVVRDSYGA